MLEIQLAEDFVRLVGPKGRHNPARAAVRHGSEPGQVTLGDRRVSVSRPRTADGTGKVTVPTYQAFASTDLMDQLALERMLAKLSSAATRPVVGTRPGSGGRPVQGVVIPGGEQQRAPMLEQPSISTLATTARRGRRGYVADHVAGSPGDPCDPAAALRGRLQNSPHAGVASAGVGVAVQGSWSPARAPDRRPATGDQPGAGVGGRAG
jgi:hypothetical protein